MAALVLFSLYIGVIHRIGSTLIWQDIENVSLKAVLQKEETLYTEGFFYKNLLIHLNLFYPSTFFFSLCKIVLVLFILQTR